MRKENDKKYIVTYIVIVFILVILKSVGILQFDWLIILAPIWAPIIAGVIIIAAIIIWSFIEQKVKK